MFLFEIISRQNDNFIISVLILVSTILILLRIELYLQLDYY